jgi:hypothetical protein
MINIWNKYKDFVFLGIIVILLILNITNSNTIRTDVKQYQKRLEFESLFESMGMSLPKDDKIEKLKTKLEDDPFSEIRLDILATEEATSADTTSPASNISGTPDAPEEKTNEKTVDKPVQSNLLSVEEFEKNIA